MKSKKPTMNEVKSAIGMLIERMDGLYQAVQQSNLTFTEYVLFKEDNVTFTEYLKERFKESDSAKDAYNSSKKEGM